MFLLSEVCVVKLGNNQAVSSRHCGFLKGGMLEVLRGAGAVGKPKLCLSWNDEASLSGEGYSEGESASQG